MYNFNLKIDKITILNDVTFLKNFSLELNYSFTSFLLCDDIYFYCFY